RTGEDSPTSRHRFRPPRGARHARGAATPPVAPQCWGPLEACAAPLGLLAAPVRIPRSPCDARRSPASAARVELYPRPPATAAVTEECEGPVLREIAQHWIAQRWARGRA